MLVLVLVDVRACMLVLLCARVHGNVTSIRYTGSNGSNTPAVSERVRAVLDVLRFFVSGACAHC